MLRNEVGTIEGPLSNQVKYNKWFYKHDVSGDDFKWCAVFISWMFDQAAMPGIHTAGALALKNEPGLAWHSGNDGIEPGDVVAYKFNGKGHCGIVVSVQSSTIHAIEGNTSAGNAGSQTNGGGVFERTRKRDSSIVGYGRPNYAAALTELQGGLEMELHVVQSTERPEKGEFLTNGLDEIRTLTPVALVHGRNLGLYPKQTTKVPEEWLEWVRQNAAGKNIPA